MLALISLSIFMALSNFLLCHTKCLKDRFKVIIQGLVRKALPSCADISFSAHLPLEVMAAKIAVHPGPTVDAGEAGHRRIACRRNFGCLAVVDFQATLLMRCG